MNRLIFCLIVCGYFPGFAQEALAQPRMNVLMIVADDMNGYGTAKEYPPAMTPYLDKLASESVNFVHGVCNAPVCTPSRG